MDLGGPDTVTSLAVAAGLADPECLAVVVALCGELDPALAEQYAYLNGDPAAGTPRRSSWPPSMTCPPPTNGHCSTRTARCFAFASSNPAPQEPPGHAHGPQGVGLPARPQPHRRAPPPDPVRLGRSRRSQRNPRRGAQHQSMAGRPGAEQRPGRGQPGRLIGRHPFRVRRRSD